MKRYILHLEPKRGKLRKTSRSRATAVGDLLYRATYFLLHIDRLQATNLACACCCAAILPDVAGVFVLPVMFAAINCRTLQIESAGIVESVAIVGAIKCGVIILRQGVYSVATFALTTVTFEVVKRLPLQIYSCR